MDDLTVYAIFSFFIVVPLLYLYSQSQQLKRKQQAYQAALNRLQMKTSKANKIAALQAGRDLAAFCRAKGKVAIFDEVALQNDLQAYGGD